MGKFITIATLAFVAMAAKGQNLAYIVNQASNSLSVMSTVDETILHTIPVGNFPDSIAFSPDGSRGYVTLGNDFRLAVIDLANNVIVDSIPLANGLSALAISPDGARAWVTNVFGSVAVVNLTTKAIEAVIPVGSVPTDIAITPVSRRSSLPA